MINIEQAISIINSVIRDYGTRQIALQAAVGSVLREDLRADRPFPPFDRVTMDGIAFQHASFAQGRRQFLIEGIAAAGDEQKALLDPNKCMEVMTGAVLPQGTDTVMRYEDLTIENGVAQINIEDLPKGKNVHPKGFDRKENELLVPAGRFISPAEIGVAATIGKSQLCVSQTPKIAIISTGNELIETSSTPLPHQIRKSNVYMLQSLLSQMQIESTALHLNDDYEIIVKKLKVLLAEYDVLIVSGGVSAGKFDYLPRAFNELGIKEHFHKVKQRPGKPMWFGESPRGTVIFALPGNPISTFSCAQKYVLPWLRASIGLPATALVYARLSQDFIFKPQLTYFLQVQTSFNKTGELIATPVTGNGSGDLANLTNADGFLELPRNKEIYKKGEVYPFTAYR